MSYAAWDIETSTRTSFKRKANPFDPLNYIVASGFKVQGQTVVLDYLGGPHAVRPADWFTKILKQARILVGFNIKFDLLHALRDPANLEAWMEWVAGGGNVWDCQLAEYLLLGMPQESHMLSLDEVCPKYGGNLKIDEVKILWEQGVDTIDINPDLLTRYLDGDVTNTELIFVGQLAKARKAGQVKSILMNMGSLLCTIEMERNGMAVDKAKGMQLAAELSIHLQELEQSLNGFLPPDLPFEFSWSSRVHLSALIFGGTVKYVAKVPLLSESGGLTYPLKEVQEYYLADGGFTTEEPTLETGSNYLIFKSGKNAGMYKSRKTKVPDTSQPHKLRNEERYFPFRGFTVPLSKWKTDSPGVYSVAGAVITELGETTDIPFLKALATVAKVRKDLGTYYYTIDEKGVEKGMLTLVQPDGIIHHSLNHTSTVTARFSSSNPNLQNIPKGQMDDDGNLLSGSQVKTLFVSRWGEDGVICQSDFTALEVYVQAILTKCKQLIEDLLAGLDMHCARVAQKEGMTYEEVYDLAVVKKIPEWHKKRTGAKNFSFQRAYGAGAAAISVSTKIPVDDVKALIAAEEQRYPEIEPFYADVTEAIKDSRVPTARFAPHPDFPGRTCQFGRGWYRTPDNKLYCYQESAAPKFVVERGGALTSFSPTEIKNYIVQGGGGEWAKAAMWLAIRLFYKYRNLEHFALLVNQVHDAVYGDFHKKVHARAAAMLHACMVEASTFMEYYFDWEVPVPVPSVTQVGANMMEERNVVDGHYQEYIAQYRQELRASYMGGYTPSFERKAA